MPPKTPEGRSLLDALLSDAFLLPKQLLLWLLMMACVLYCSQLTERSELPGLDDFLLEPARYDASPLSLSYVPLNTYAPYQGELLRTSAGFVPLEQRHPPARPGEVVSVRGTWTRLGRLAVQELWWHPLRKLKSSVSMWTSLVLALALLLRYGPLLLGVNANTVLLPSLPASPALSHKDGQGGA